MLVINRKRILNIVCDEVGNPIAVSDADTGMDASKIYLGKSDEVTWQSLDETPFTVQFKSVNGQPIGQPFDNWGSDTGKSGNSVLGKVGNGHKGKKFAYGIAITGKITLDPEIIIEK